MSAKRAKRRGRARGRKDGAHIYQRGVRGSWFADLRPWKELLAPGEQALHFPLRPPGLTQPTTDEAEALHLYNQKRAELEARRHAQVFDVKPVLTLAEFVPQFLTLRNEEMSEQRRAKKNVRETAWLRDVAFFRALRFFRGHLKLDPTLGAIKPVHVQAWLKRLATDAGDTAQEEFEAPQALSKGTIHHHRWALNALFTKAVFLELAPSNPVAKLPKERARHGVKRFRPHVLEAPDAALLLEAARVLRLPRGVEALDCLRELLAVFLLAGLRSAEARGLLVRDCDWERSKLHVTGQANPFRPDLKTLRSERTLPIFPQLREIVYPHWSRRLAKAGPDALLFPRAKGEAMITDFRKAFTYVLTACGIARCRVHDLRHTFASHALQLVRGGYPITTFDVAKLLGHTSSALVEERYGHLLDDVKSRSEVIEYRVEHFVHRPAFHARLTAVYAKAGLEPLAKVITPTAEVRK